MKEGILMKDYTIKAYQLKSGAIRYGFRIYTGINPKTGKPSQTTKRGFFTYQEALKEKQRIHNLVTHHKYFQEPVITFLDVYSEWFDLKSLSVKPTTLLTYQSHLTSFQSLFYLKITEIGTTHIQSIFNHLLQILHSQQSLDAKWSFISMIFEYAFNCRYIEVNPLTTIPKPQLHLIKKETKKYLTENELSQFLMTVKQENFKYYCLCLLAAMTGMRIGELMALKWQNIDFKHHTISITQNDVLDLNHKPMLSTPKTKSSIRTIEIDTVTENTLKQWHLQENDAIFVFPNRKCQLANTDIPKTWINRFCHQHPELPYISFHSFRHTHASMLFSHHVPPKVIQKRLGHSSIKVTMDVYTHLTESQHHDSMHQFFEELNIN